LGIQTNSRLAHHRDPFCPRLRGFLDGVVLNELLGRRHWTEDREATSAEECMKLAKC